ncbi:nucleotidyltransferase domain-containing protein [Algoriphagus chordae]|uniref:Putative nucleotidyltransferase n=1 Tax=Algoriphagus chordae TaxID=237019 RepID=A0A2W7QNQ3_9BACT|nr:nucleotidyltransferase domain-containing protein [Algoriphagus chordae]PZX48926.1 putative nucleotidyltransferase [Algoriphagus chordae]
MADQRIITILNKYIESIPQAFGLRSAFLFGSYAKGSQKEESDLDIALVLDHMDDFFETQMKLRKLRRSIDLRIEPHPIKTKDFNAKNPFALEIKATGINLI